MNERVILTSIIKFKKILFSFYFSELEEAVRSIVMDGLLWGSSKLVPVGYGINKLQITTVVEDDKVSVEELTEKLEGFEDFVSYSANKAEPIHARDDQDYG